ncbi:hypothetical protein NHF46_18530 [Arthrobacter alpinus]|nr:hypothetical protein [Arthrobacter alpinus]
MLDLFPQLKASGANYGEPMLSIKFLRALILTVDAKPGLLATLAGNPI